jgi:hypothetical protein
MIRFDLIGSCSSRHLASASHHANYLSAELLRGKFAVAAMQNSGK